MAPRSTLLRDKFLHTLSEADRYELIHALEGTLIHILETERAVALEPFGILSPNNNKSQKIFISSEHQIIQSVSARVFIFHKTGEITSYHREEFKNLVEEKELTQRVCAKLPITFLLRHDFRSIRQLLRGMIENLKHECISGGVSKLLSKIGTFIALHNRQGDSFHDWFAGADILLVNPLERTITSDDCRRLKRPVLNDAWELFGAIFGKPVSIFKVRMKDEIRKLGIDPASLPFVMDDAASRISIALFEYRSGNTRQLIYCTDGLRTYGINSKSKNNISPFGNELVFQVNYDSDFIESSRSDSDLQDDLRLPHWPKFVLALGWALLQSNTEKTIKIGEGLSAGKCLSGNKLLSKLTTVFATGFARSRQEHLTKEGPFYYINLLGITDNEAQLAERSSPDLLLSILEGRKCDQITKIGRPCLTNKSSLMGVSFISSQKKENHQNQVVDSRLKDLR